MTAISLRYSSPRFEVCPPALAVEGVPGGLASVLVGHVLLLEAETLGLAPGHYQAGPLPLGLDGAGRLLYAVTDDEAAAITTEGGTVRKATAAADWPHPFAVPVAGMRLRHLRAFLRRHQNLADDTLVVIGAADHCHQGEDSPALSAVRVGEYVPDLRAHGPSGAFWDPQWDADEPRPVRSIPAVLISPSA